MATASDKKRSAKFLEARGALPSNLWDLYEQLVDEYSYFALLRTGRSWVAYGVIADLLLAGWRPTGDDKLLTNKGQAKRLSPSS